MRKAEDGPNRSKQTSPPRGDVSIADAVTAAALLGATQPADIAAICEALHLTIPIVPVGPPPGPTPVPPQPSRTSSSTIPQATTPNRAGIIGMPVPAQLRQDDRTEPIPTWLDTVPALSSAGSGSFGVPPEPPLPAVQARSSMVTLTASWRPGRRLDMVTLVKRSARLEPPTACFLAELRTVPLVQILVDRGEGMEPYADDLDFLTAQLVDVAGRDRVEQRTFVGTPRTGARPRRLHRRGSRVEAACRRIPGTNPDRPRDGGAARQPGSGPGRRMADSRGNGGIGPGGPQGADAVSAKPIPAGIR